MHNFDYNSFSFPSLSTVSSVGQKTSKLIGFSDLKNGIQDIYSGKYQEGLVSLAKGTLRVSVTALTAYTAYKVADYAYHSIPFTPPYIEEGTCDLSEAPIVEEVCNLSEAPISEEICELSEAPIVEEVCDLSETPITEEVCNLSEAPLIEEVCDYIPEDFSSPLIINSPIALATGTFTLTSETLPEGILTPIQVDSLNTVVPPVNETTSILENIEETSNNQETVPVDFQKPTGKCPEAKNLNRWGVTCEEFKKVPSLKEFVNKPEYYKPRNFWGEKLSFKHNSDDELLIRMDDKYMRWDQFKEILKTSRVVSTENGYALFGAPYSIKPNEAKMDPGHYVDVMTSYNGLSHNWIRMHEVASNHTTSHSFGFYTEEISDWNMGKSAVSSTKGDVKSPDIIEFDINDRSSVSQTRFSITEGQYNKVKEMMSQDHGDYDVTNICGQNCRGFTEKVLELINKPTNEFFRLLPSSLGNAIKELGATTTDPKIIKIAK